MNPVIQRGLGTAFRYGPLAFVTIWVAWIAAEIRYIQGWWEALGSAFHYPATELACATAALALGWYLASTGKPGGSIIASVIFLISGAYWLGCVG